MSRKLMHLPRTLAAFTVSSSKMKAFPSISSSPLLKSPLWDVAKITSAMKVWFALSSLCSVFKASVMLVSISFQKASIPYSPKTFRRDLTSRALKWTLADPPTKFPSLKVLSFSKYTTFGPLTTEDTYHEAYFSRMVISVLLLLGARMGILNLVREGSSW